MIVNLSKVAHRANVSSSTASMILNNRNLHQFSDETEKRVRKAAKDMNYTNRRQRRSQQQAGLRPGLIGNVAVLSTASTSDIMVKGAYVPCVLDGVQSAAREMDLQITLATGLDTPAKFEKYLQTSRERVDGILLLGPVNEETEKVAARSPLPLVVASDPYQHPVTLHRVQEDGVGGALQIVEYLMSLGHSRIAYLGIASTYYYQERLAGYAQAFLASNQIIDPRLIVSVPKYADLTPRLHAIFEMKDPPTAVFAGTGQLAADARALIATKGLRVPEDVSIAAFTYNDGAGSTDWVTRINDTPGNIGRMGLSHLMHLVSNPKMPVCTMLIHGELIPSGSTAPRINL